MSDDYGTDGGGGLYDTGPSSPQPKQGPSPATPVLQGRAIVEPDPAEALSQAVQVIASPASLLSDVLPPDPNQSKIPQSLAILGCLAVACIWANSMMKEK